MRTVAVLLLFFCSTGFAEETVEIPLSEIWGINLRGVKDASRLEMKSDGRAAHESLTHQIYMSLSRIKRSTDKHMQPGFAVPGEGKEALGHVHAVLVKGQAPQNTFSHGENVSIVFFTRTIEFMELVQVERTGTTITIKYCLEPVSSNPLVSPKGAVIPLGQLPAGKYRVNIIGFTKKPDAPNSPCKPIADDRVAKLICQPFKFSVHD